MGLAAGLAREVLVARGVGGVEPEVFGAADASGAADAAAVVAVASLGVSVGAALVDVPSSAPGASPQPLTENAVAASMAIVIRFMVLFPLSRWPIGSEVHVVHAVH